MVEDDVAILVVLAHLKQKGSKNAPSALYICNGADKVPASKAATTQCCQKDVRRTNRVISVLHASTTDARSPSQSGCARMKDIESRNIGTNLPIEFGHEQIILCSILDVMIEFT